MIQIYLQESPAIDDDLRWYVCLTVFDTVWRGEIRSLLGSMWARWSNRWKFHMQNNSKQMFWCGDVPFGGYKDLSIHLTVFDPSKSKQSF